MSEKEIHISLEWLKERGACLEGVNWFKAQSQTELAAVCHALISESRAVWANWVITRLMNKPQCVRYAVFAAEQVLHLFASKHPNHDQPRKAIEAAKEWLENPSAAAASAARAAAYAADAAAYAAYAAYAADAADAAAAAAAADAAYAAAYAAAAYDAAADAADAYGAAAYDAAADAADAYGAAARKEMQSRIVAYGIKLLRGEDE